MLPFCNYVLLGGVVHGNGLASCYACYSGEAAIRAVASPAALADEAELTVRGEPPLRVFPIWEARSQLVPASSRKN